MADFVFIQMDQRIQHRVLPVVENVIVRQRYPVDTGVDQSPERLRLGPEGKRLLSRLAADRDRSL
ncbi:hypothetical protein D3C80_1983880 [compost metagenome]